MSGEPLPQLRQGQRHPLPVRAGQHQIPRTALQRQHHTTAVPFQRLPYPPPQRPAGELGGDQHLCLGRCLCKGFRDDEGQAVFPEHPCQPLRQREPVRRLRPVGQHACCLLCLTLRQHLPTKPVQPSGRGRSDTAHHQDAPGRQRTLSRPEKLAVRGGLVGHGDGGEGTGESRCDGGGGVGEKKRQGV